MPIPARVVSPPPVPTRPTAPTPVEWGRTAISVIGRGGQGEEIPLTSFGGREWPGIILQPGATGLDMPPMTLFSDESPSLDGAIFRSARASAREIMIPVYLHGVDRQSINALKRRLFQVLNPRHGSCLLRFTEGDGQTRHLNAYYKGGMEGSENSDTAGFTWAKYGLQFSALDPWFYLDHPQTVRWDFGVGESLVSATSSFFPMHISRGVMGGPGELLLISNPGDIEAWPIWTLTGPIKSFRLTGPPTGVNPQGASIRGDAPVDGSDIVAAGRVLTIDTRPGKKTVADDQGVNYWNRLSANPQFWSVDPGDTAASVSVVTSGRSSVTLLFHPRYASFV